MSSASAQGCDACRVQHLRKLFLLVPDAWQSLTLSFRPSRGTGWHKHAGPMRAKIAANTSCTNRTKQLNISVRLTFALAPGHGDELPHKSSPAGDFPFGSAVWIHSHLHDRGSTGGRSGKSCHAVLG